MKAESHFYEFGPFRLDAAERQLLREDRVLPLTPKPLTSFLCQSLAVGWPLEVATTGPRSARLAVAPALRQAAGAIVLRRLDKLQLWIS